MDQFPLTHIQFIFNQTQQCELKNSATYSRNPQFCNEGVGPERTPRVRCRKYVPIIRLITTHDSASIPINISLKVPSLQRLQPKKVAISSKSFWE